MKLIGRKQEQDTLATFFNSEDAEFLAIYGRRRVGKTFLVREFFKDKTCFFELTGQKDGKLHDQLNNFMSSINATFKPPFPIQIPSSWKEAFSLLTTFIETQKELKIVIFIDELPWLASKRSGFLQALDYYWNRKWSQIANVKLIVCGSAASWMLENVVLAKGGLYNRLTQIIQLKPFTLSETKVYLESRDIKLQNSQILELYMVFGGIPYYLRYIEKGKSAQQNVNDLCFRKESLFFTEFDILFKSLFDHSEIHKQLIIAIASKRNGISRDELLKLTGMKSGGTFKKRLDELQAASFIECFTPYNKRKKDFYIKIIDEYTLFYLNWIAAVKSSPLSATLDDYWHSISQGQSYKSWSGYAFEAVCFKHINQIVKRLNLLKVAKEVGSWRYIPKNSQAKEQGAQIDLLIDRTDSAITLCEMKYSNKEYTIDKSYAKNLINKQTVFEERTKTEKQIFMAMITTNGIKHNVWSEDLIHSEVILEDLFLD